MKILGIESSATSASVAVCVDGKITAQSFSNTGLTHSQTLLPMVESTLTIAGVSIRDVDFFAVSNGPGSFTGVRIGVSAVKGMAQPLNKNCFQISTLEAIAKPLENTGCHAVSVMDARCNQVYTAQFDCECGFNRVTDDAAISIDELAETLKGIDKPIVLIGDGAIVTFNKLKDVVPAVSMASQGIRYQSAASVCLVAYEKAQNGEEGISANDVLPEYLRLSQAERELKMKNNK